MAVMAPDSLPSNLRKCPIHKCWIQMNQLKDHQHFRYCPVCLRQKMIEEAKVFKEAGTLPPNVRIGKI